MSAGIFFSSDVWLVLEMRSKRSCILRNPKYKVPRQAGALLNISRGITHDHMSSKACEVAKLRFCLAPFPILF